MSPAIHRHLRAIAVVAASVVVGTAVISQPTVASASTGGVGYTYDENGRLLAVTDPNSDTAVYSYDSVGNVLSIKRHPSSTLSLIHFAPSSGAPGFDPSPSGDVDLTYDDYDRLTKVDSPQGSISYGYDAGDRLTSETIGASPPLAYAYDAAGNLQSIAQAATTLVSKVYDAANRLTSLTLPDGIVEAPTYDAASQLTGITYSLGTTTLGNLGYGYDSAGRRTSVSGSFAATGLPQPVSSATYDAANELTSWNGTTLSYDANGNLTNDGTSTYTWDARGQLSSIAGPGVSASFGYDGLGNRVRKTSDGMTTSYLYDGTNVAQEQSGGSVSASILSGGTDEYFARTDAGGTRSYLTDALGSTVAMADASGSMQTSYTYEPFGKATSAGASDPNPNQFTGRENDGTGLQYNRARYYSPTLQRFISQDPLGFDGGDVNTYAYAADSPTNFSDPSGEFLPLLAIAGGCAIGAGLSLGSSLIGAKLTGRKLNVGDMLASAGVACLEGAAMGILAGAIGTFVADVFGDAIAGVLSKLFSRPAGEVGLDAAGFIDSSVIRFTQSSVKSAFGDGGTIDDLAAGLRSGEVDPSDVPPIRLMENDGELYTLDNRRLVAFQKAGMDIPYRMASPQEVGSEAWKFTTTTLGRSIRIRGGGGVWSPDGPR